jgi:hypothetical protein
VADRLDAGIVIHTWAGSIGHDADHPGHGAGGSPRGSQPSPCPAGSGRTPHRAAPQEREALFLYWFGVNVTVLDEGYRNRSMVEVGSCGRLVELGAAKALCAEVARSV